VFGLYRHALRNLRIQQMPKDAPRGARSRAPDIDPFPGNHPPSVEELDHGLDFFECDPLADAIHWSTGLLLDFLDIHPLVRTALERLSSCSVSVPNLSACESACDEVADDLKLRPEDRDRYADYAARCVYYAAFLGDHGCALRIPTEAGHPFRREAGQRSDLMSATIPR
jgi:hypothetical protein